MAWIENLPKEPGAVFGPEPETAGIALLGQARGPMAGHLTRGAPIALLGLEPHTRRRNRVNGHIGVAAPEGLLVEVRQSFGNCPQYIQGRDVQWVRDAADLQPRAALALTSLDADARALIDRSDTLFIATREKIFAIKPGTKGESANAAGGGK